MNSIYQQSDYQSLIERIDTLTPQTQGQWGKMDVAQMLAHCAVGIQMALGDLKPKRSFIGILIGRFYKGMLTGAMRMPKNSPTATEFKMTEPKNFGAEKANLIVLLERMHKGGEAAATTHPNPFFGKLTPTEWGQGQYTHIDYHLKQFGV